MIKAYKLVNKKLDKIDTSSLQEINFDEADWIDLIDPTPEEVSFVSSLCSMAIPSMEEVNELESSSHHLLAEECIQFNSLYFHRPGGEPKNTSVAFIYDSKRLITLCSYKLPQLRLLRRRNKIGITFLSNPIEILLVLQDIRLEGLGDDTEQIYHTLSDIQKEVLSRRSEDLESAIDGLADQEILIGTTRLCLMDAQRDLRFLSRLPLLQKKYLKQANGLLQDVDSLMPHNNFLSDKADFLLNAALGFINMEQNRLMKIFSVAALIFLPPTLVGAIYGMNFQVMPELSLPWGYPMALGMMALVAGVPYLFLKRKGWL
jgi:magnesium transporter